MTSFAFGKWLGWSSGGKKNGSMWEASSEDAGCLCGPNKIQVRSKVELCLVMVCDVCPNNVDSYTGNIKVYTSSVKMCTKTAPSAFIIPKFNFEVY